VVQLDRMRGILRDEDAVVAKFGVRPESIPDYLAVVGDSADGFPGLAGWGPKAAALTFSEYPHFEDIPKDWRQWPSAMRGAQRLAGVLFQQWNDALLYRTLATLKLDVPVFETVDELSWKGPRPEFERYSNQIKTPGLNVRARAAVKSG
jgi:5'-3' exonuclease